MKIDLDPCATGDTEYLLKDQDGRLLFLCPRCRNEYGEHILHLQECLQTRVLLDDPTFPLEDLEEVRLHLKSFLRKEVLDAVLELYKELMADPQPTEAFSWFVANGVGGHECKYAQAALRRFKRERLDNVVEIMERCLPLLKEMQNENH